MVVNWGFLISFLMVMLFLAGSWILLSCRRWRGTLRHREAVRQAIKVQMKKYGAVVSAINEREGNPISFARRILRRMQHEKYDKEIFEAVSFLRNLTAVGKGQTTNTDYILEMLAESKGALQPIYLQMLSYLRLNRRKDAADVFAGCVESGVGKDFAWFLIQWDEINPEELSEALFSFEKRMKEVRMTTLKRRDETVSDLIYLPVVINIMMIFINFIFVAYFFDQRELLEMFMASGK